MTTIHLAILFAVIGVVLIVADLFLPSHGLLSLAGVLGLLVSVVCCFVISGRLGFVVLAGLVIVSPFAVMGALKIWPNTPIGRRLVLTEGAPGKGAVVHVGRIPGPGERGITLTALRPTGVVEFDGAGAAPESRDRIEASTDTDLIPAGTRVVVTGVSERRPVVRPDPPAGGSSQAGAGVASTGGVRREE